MRKRKTLMLGALVISLSVLLLFAACKKEEPKITSAETTTPQNTASGSDGAPTTTVVPGTTSGKVPITTPNTTTNDNKGEKMPVSCDFKNMTLDEFKSIWSVTDEVDSKWKLDSEKGFVITSYRGELYESQNTCKNIFFQSGDGDYTVEVKINVPERVSTNFQQAGILLFVDRDNYIKFVHSYDGASGVQFASEVGGKFTSHAKPSLEADTVWLRIRKEGNNYTASYTTEGPYSGFHSLGSWDINLKNPSLALTAFNGESNAASIDFEFEYLSILDVDAPSSLKSEYTLDIDKTELRLNPGDKASVKAEVVEADDAGKVTYKSSDEKVVTVDENGVVTAVGEGYAVISANVYKGRAVYCAVSVTPEELYVYESLGNPYLPIWEHIPDGEPYVFEDPDNPGKYRVYVYGSHDTKLSHYCGYEQVVWSAPVDDLTKWTYHGEIFKSTVQGTKDTLYAPDMVEVVNADGSKTYYFYPNNQTGGRRGMVAKSSRPDGPFLTCNWSDENITETVGPLGFDVAVLYDDDGRVYGYWGFENNEDCCFAELDPNTMATLKEGTEIRLNLPTRSDIDSAKYDPSKYNIYQDENVKKWGFFEAPSIRKIGNKYVLIFSRRGLLTEPTGCNTFQLAYGYSDSPEGPWKWGGIIVDAGGEAIPKTSTSYDRTFPADNTHGSICEINGQWYVFYHRSNNRYSRQSTLDAITVEWDEKSVAEGGAVRISMAETTSNGMYLDGLEPYKKYPASIVCYLTGGSNILAEYDKDKIDPVIIASSQSVAGVKYFNFDKNAPVGKSTSLAVTLRPLGKDVKVDVYLRPVSAVNTPLVYDENKLIVSVGEGSFKIGTVNITADMEQIPTHLTLSADEIDSLDGKWGIFFVFTGSGSNLCEFHSFELYTDKPTEDKEEEENSAVIYDFTKMTESELLENFDIVRENKDHYEISKSGLTINNQKAGLYGGGGSCENIFLADVEGDFVAEVKVTMSEALSANWQQFVLLVYQNDDNYVKMNYGMNGGTGCQLLFEKDGSEKKSYGAGLSTTEIWLRIEKVGNLYRGFYSTDGISYTLIGEAYEFTLENVKIGLAAHNDGGDAPSIDFNIEYLKIEKK